MQKIPWVPAFAGTTRWNDEGAISFVTPANLIPSSPRRTQSLRHPGEGRGLGGCRTSARCFFWVPAFAGTTRWSDEGAISFVTPANLIPSSPRRTQSLRHPGEPDPLRHPGEGRGLGGCRTSARCFFWVPAFAGTTRVPERRGCGNDEGAGAAWATGVPGDCRGESLFALVVRLCVAHFARTLCAST